MLRMMFAVLVSALVAVACSLLPVERPQDFSPTLEWNTGSLPAERPQDFSLTLEWNTGSLPPQYTYMYVISLGPGLQGRLEYRPGYDPNDTSRQWVTAFSVSEQQMKELFFYLQNQDMFRSNWKKGELMMGGSGTSLILNAYGKEFHVPSISEVDHTEFARVDAAIEAIRALVPQTIWDEMDARQAEYEDHYEE